MADRSLARIPALGGVVVIALTWSACAGPAGSGGASTTGPAAGRTVRESSNVVSGEELRATRAANLWDALRQLHPEWLRSRASASLISGPGGEPVVYVQGIQHGPLRSLQQMNIERVRRVEFIDGRDATTRFGTGYGGGVIMVDLDRS